jgi:AcrR family transcriptional regulator
MELAREKPYPSIAVKEILERANVGRSTFYTHYDDKDDLLESGIEEVLRSNDAQFRPANAAHRILAFSLPLLKHIDEHRRAAGPEMAPIGRVVMHQHLETTLRNRLVEELRQLPSSRRTAFEIPADLLAGHLAATFVLVLDWWVERHMALTPAEVDARFRALVTPVLT